MGKNAIVSRFGAAFALAVALVFGCAFAALPGSAYAAGLVAGSYQVLDEMTAPTVSEVLTTGAGKLKVTISGAYNNADGYEYQVSLNSAFTNPKTALVATTATSSTKTFTGLKAGKKYYVRARQYGMVDGLMIATNWSAVKSGKTAIKNSKSKIMGVWKITGSNIASISSTIKHNKRISSSAKATLTFKKNGIIMLTDYDKSKSKLTNSWGKWIALTKTKGQTIYSGQKFAKITVTKKGKKLTLNANGNKIYCQKI